jgi:hypothetical protein
MPYAHNYPASVREVLRRNRKYKGDVLRAVKGLRRSKAWRGSYQERAAKFLACFTALREAYGLDNLSLVFSSENQHSEGYGYYVPSEQKIVLGKLSVVTFLHEFAHALGKDERQACIWSINLFKRCFPNSFDRCDALGHMLVRRAS